MSSGVRILLAVVLVVAVTMVSWTVGAIVLIGLGYKGVLPNPPPTFLVVLNPVIGVVLGLLLAAKVFSGKPRK
jgi:hypothetical protein